jgi:ubiquinone/menaquinone biosynthesis C-methylase UbiE
VTATRPDEAQIAGLLDGYLTTQLVYVAAKLGVAKALADGPRTGAEVADAVGADASALTRVLRGLAIEEVVDECDDGRFALTSVGASVLDPRGAIVVRGELYYRAAAGLLDAVRDGGVAFESVYGEPFFAHLDRHREHQSAFGASMAARAEREANHVVAAYDFTALRTLVDVGGGRGVLLAAILQAAPALRAVLVERPAAIEVARQRLQADGVADRCEFAAGDFFDAVPAAADAYLLSRVIHDWDDADAVRILRTCRAAMPSGARLLLVEAVLPERAVDQPAAIRMDLHMLVLFGARERTEAQYCRLLAEAGLEFRRAVPTRSPAGLSVIEAAPV